MRTNASIGDLSIECCRRAQTSLSLPDFLSPTMNSPFRRQGFSLHRNLDVFGVTKSPVRSVRTGHRSANAFRIAKELTEATACRVRN